MSGDTHHAKRLDSLAARVQEATGVSLADCYQCGKCAAGCPVAEDMDHAPCQILHMLQLEMPEMDKRVLKSHGIWLCLACETCVTRCPKEVDLPKVMDFLREEALRQGLEHPKGRDILAFHRAFLDSIEQTGRLFEVGLVADYKLRSRHFLKDVALAPTMYMKGKLGLFPHIIKGRKALKQIFKRTIGNKG